MGKEEGRVIGDGREGEGEVIRGSGMVGGGEWEKGKRK